MWKFAAYKQPDLKALSSSEFWMLHAQALLILDREEKAAENQAKKMYE